MEKRRVVHRGDAALDPTFEAAALLVIPEEVSSSSTPFLYADAPGSHPLKGTTINSRVSSMVIALKVLAAGDQAQLPLNFAFLDDRGRGFVAHVQVLDLDLLRAGGAADGKRAACRRGGTARSSG